VSEIVERLGLNLVSEPQSANRGSGLEKQRADINQPLADGERTQALTELCGRYIRQGLDDDTILVILRAWNHRNLEPLPDEKLVNTLDSIRRCDNRNKAANDPVVEDFNQHHAVVMMGGKTLVVRLDPDQVVPMSVPSFRDYYSNRPRVEDVTAAHHWLCHPDRRTYRQAVFNPSGQAANDELNLWRGLAVNPKEGDCSLYLAHVRENIAAGDEVVYQYLLDWMADAVQNPHRLPGVAITLRGRQGTGKGVFISQFGKIFGRHFKHVQTPDHLTGKFTQHLADALLVFADEVVWGGDKQREGVLKALITEERRFVEPKGVNAYEVGNYIRLMMATNNDWAVPAGGEERRFCVLDVGDNRMQDSDYFQAIVTQMDSGGREALLYMLLHRDITDVNIRNFPKTAALFDQKELSLDSVLAWWLDCLREGRIVGVWSPRSIESWPTWMSTADLYQAYSVALKTEKYPRNPAKSKALFVKTLMKVAVLNKSRPRVDSVAEGEGRPRGFTFPSLAECREAFEKALGQEIFWDE
jgi:hypothetical protein